MLQKQLLDDLLNLKKIKNTLGNSTPPIETIRDSEDFFLNELEADKSIFLKYPLLLSFKVEGNLRPKSEFYIDYIGIKKEKVAKSPGLFTNSLDLVKDRFLHYLKKDGWNEEQVKALFRKADSIPGYDTATIDDKIDKYDRSDIDFHQNYSLLEKKPHVVVDTKEYLGDELHILPPSEEDPINNSSYYMLLAVSKETIKPKVTYCNNESISWEEAPRILILGLGTEEKLGALPRRVNLIKKAFQNKQLPPKLDYLKNPKVLINSDKVLKNKIKRYS